MTQGSSDEFGGRVSIVFRFNELVHVHILFVRGINAIEVLQRDTGEILHGYSVGVVVRFIQRFHCRFQPIYSHPRRRARQRKTKVVDVHLGIFVVFFQTDDGWVPLDVSGKVQADATDQMVDDAIEEEHDIHHEFAHPPLVRFLVDGPLQHVGLSDSI